MALESIARLPDTATWEDIQERINFIAGVRRAMQQMDAGQGIPQEEIAAEFTRWLGKSKKWKREKRLTRQ